MRFPLFRRLRDVASGKEITAVRLAVTLRDADHQREVQLLVTRLLRGSVIVGRLMRFASSCTPSRAPRTLRTSIGCDSPSSPVSVLKKTGSLFTPDSSCHASAFCALRLGAMLGYRRLLHHGRKLDAVAQHGCSPSTVLVTDDIQRPREHRSGPTASPPSPSCAPHASPGGSHPPRLVPLPAPPTPPP